MYALHEKHLTMGQAVHLTVLMLASMGMPCDILAMKAQPSPVDLLLLVLLLLLLPMI
jgi:hypothetical protein